MKIVVDTNILFSALVAKGKTRQILLREDVEFYVPEFFFKELRKYIEDISEKSGLKRRDVKILLNLLLENIQIVPKSTFEHKLLQAKKLIGNIDPDDVPFLALALSLNQGVIWTEDKDFRNQEKVKIITTSEMIKQFGVR